MTQANQGISSRYELWNAKFYAQLLSTLHDIVCAVTQKENILSDGDLTSTSAAIIQTIKSSIKVSLLSQYRMLLSKYNLDFH